MASTPPGERMREISANPLPRSGQKKYVSIAVTMSKDPSSNGRPSTDARQSPRVPSDTRSASTSEVILSDSSDMSAPCSVAYGYLSDSLLRKPPPPHPTSRMEPSMLFGRCERQKSHRGRWCSFIPSRTVLPSSPTGFLYCWLSGSSVMRSGWSGEYFRKMYGTVSRGELSDMHAVIRPISDRLALYRTRNQTSRLPLDCRP